MARTVGSNGPFKILSKVGDYVYKLDTGNSRIHPIVPHDLLRLEPNGEYITTRDFDPPSQLEWDYEYQFPDIETEQADLRKFEGLDSGGNEDHSTHGEDRPIILVDNIVQPADRGRPVRARRPPDRYPGYVLD